MTEPINLLILKTVATYYTLQRQDIQRLCMPGSDRDGRTCRRHLNQLCQGKLLNKTNGEVVFQDRNGAPAPVYFPSRLGCELLAAETKDDRYLSVCTYTPNWQHLYHWLGVARFHVLADQAVNGTEASIEHWLGEWDVADHQGKTPEQRDRLFTLLREQPRLVNAPDASFVLQYKGHRRGFYLELDRATSGVNQVASSKTLGYAALAERSDLFARHFPGAESVSFRVLMVTPTPGRRDALRAAIAKKPGAMLWRFIAQADLTPDSFLHRPIIYGCEGQGQPLIRRPEEGKP